jgi:hypothetical protein
MEILLRSLRPESREVGGIILPVTVSAPASLNRDIWEVKSLFIT